MYSQVIKNTTLALLKRLVLPFVLISLVTTATFADETCQSPYMAKIVGQEDFIYVWTLGINGLGDGQDKLVTISVNPSSKNYGKIINSLSVGGRNEAHHSGLTDDRKYLWAGGLDTNKLFIFDVFTDPAKPSLYRIITDFVEKTGGVVGPHTTYALPGRMLITGLSNNRNHGGESALVEYTNQGEYIATHWMPTDKNLQGAIKSGRYADGFSYDVRALPRRNLLLTSSFTGWSNYMMDFGSMLQDDAAMQRFGNTVVTWDLHAKKPKKILDVPGAPLELRCAWQPNHNWCITTTALTSKMWIIYEDSKGEWHSKEVADIGDASKLPLPVDISISSDDNHVWVQTFMDGKTRLFDISDPFKPKQIYEKIIGKQVNMASSSWDGTRVYFTSSLLANWDKKAEAGEQFFRAYDWNGKALTQTINIDFIKEKLGRAHQMRFGAYSLYNAIDPEKKKKLITESSVVSQVFK